MRKVIYIAILAIVTVGCARKEKTNHNKANTDKRIEITPFFRNSVYLKDIKKADGVDPQQFLNKDQFGVFVNCISSFIENTPNKIVLDPNEEPQDKQVLLTRIKDFKSDYQNWFWVDFYESWYFNTDNKMIEKEILGYCVWDYVPSKEAYRQMYCVFKDDAAAEKAKKYYFSLD